MSELEKPTIEGLVEKISENEYVNSEDIIAVEGLLRQTTDGMSDKEIFKLVATLNDMLDSTTGGLITQNGLNFAGFETAVHETTNIIIREKEAKIQEENEKVQQNQKTEEQLQAEKEKQEKEERIKENKNYLNDLLNDLPGISEEDLPKEAVDQLAETMEKASSFMKEYERLLKENPDKSPQQLEEEAMKNCNITKEFATSVEFETAVAVLVDKECAEIKKPGQTQDEYREDVKKYEKKLPNFVKKVTSKILSERKETGEPSRGVLSEMLKNFGENWKQFNEKKGVENIEKREADVKAVTYADVVEVDKLLTNIRKQESTRRRNRIKKQKSEKDKENFSKDEKRLNEFYDGIKKRYLKYNKTISEIYDELKHTEIVIKAELDFEDFLEGINKRLVSDAKGNPIKEDSISRLMETERKIRRMDIFYDAIDTAKENGSKIIDSTKEPLEKIAEEDKKAREAAITLREQCARRINLDVLEKGSTERKKVIIRKKAPNNSKSKLKDDINRMSSDKKEIVRISKEKGISTDDAAKIYFTENEKALSKYSVRERRILLGKNNLDKKIIEPSKTLKKIRVFTKEKYDGLIEMYNIDIERITGEIAKLENDFDNPKELNNKIKELENAKKKLKKVEEKSKELDRRSKKKNAIDTIDKKMAKNEEKRIFTMYLESGKSAVDIYEEILASGNEFGFDQDDMIRIVKEGARKYLQVGSELHSLVENEKLLFDYKRSLNSLQIRRENAKQKNLGDWISSYDEQIAEIKANQKISQNFNNSHRNKIFRRMGKKPPINTLPKDEQVNMEVSEIVTASAVKTPQSTEQTTNQREQTNSIKNGESNKTKGLIPNIKAIAKKAKVTNSKVKNTVSQIVGLGKQDKTKGQDSKDSKEDSFTTEENKVQNSEDAR